MKQIYFLLCLFLSITITAQNDINFDANSTAGTGGSAGVGQIGFMNVFDNPKDGNIGGFVFGNGWGIADLVAEEDGGLNTVTLKPNRVNDPDPFWTAAGQLEGNKIMDATYYIEDDNLAGTSFTFNANVISNTLNSSGLSIAYTYKAFIKVFASDYSSVLQEVNNTTLAPGDFTLSLDATGYVSGEHIQYGFEVIGPNINADVAFDTDYDNLGSIVIGENTTLTVHENILSNFNVYPNPTQDSWTIKSDQTIDSVLIYDIFGKQVMEITNDSNQAFINATNLPNGIYLAKINTNNGATSVKLVKN